MPARRPYLTGSIAKRGKRWLIRWRESGRRMTASYSTQGLARRALAGKVGLAETNRAGVAPAANTAPPLAELVKDWFERREAAGRHRNVAGERGNWTNHLAPTLGRLRPDEVTPAVLRRLIEKKLTTGRLRERGPKKERKKASDKGLSPTTVLLLVRLVSTLYSDLIEDGHATINPARALPKKVRRMLKPVHDPRTTPFLEKADDIRRVYLGLEEPFAAAFAVGAMAGLRTGEVRALRWLHVDLERRRIHVRDSAEGRLKDDESRIVPVQAALLPVLTAWKLKTGGSGLVVPPVRTRSKRSMVDEQSIGRALRDALAKLKLPRLTWYQATRHTFASQWVLAGGSIEKLRELMGHSTVLVTERYAHLRQDLFAEADGDRIAVDFSAPAGAVEQLDGINLGSGGRRGRNAAAEKP
jgi:integrase